MLGADPGQVLIGQATRRGPVGRHFISRLRSQSQPTMLGGSIPARYLRRHSRRTTDGRHHSACHLPATWPPHWQRAAAVVRALHLHLPAALGAYLQLERGQQKPVLLTTADRASRVPGSPLHTPTYGMVWRESCGSGVVGAGRAAHFSRAHAAHRASTKYTPRLDRGRRQATAYCVRSTCSR